MSSLLLAFEYAPPSRHLNVEMDEMPSPDGKMKYWNFPYEPDGSVVSGGIVEMEGFVPTPGGPIIYLNGGDDLNTPLSRVKGAGGKIIVPKTRIEKMFMAEFIDTEGNRMRFHSMN